MSDLPAPLVPADIDLRDYGFMPLDIVRLFGSDFHAQSTDGEWRAGVTLWLRSYHQVPAGSLPNDEIALTRLAEFGRDTRSWRKIRDGALRGWTKCSDGRLYHRTVAEKALEGWIEKLAQRKSSAAGNAKRYGHAFDPAVFDDAMEISRRLLINLNPQSRVLAKRGGRAPGGSADEAPGGSSDGTPTTFPSGSQGTVKGQVSNRLPSLRSDYAGADASAGPKSSYPPNAFERWWTSYPEKVGKGAAEKSFERIRKADEVPFETLIRGVEAYRKAKPPDRAWCNPATWLNQQRWRDEHQGAATTDDPSRIDFGGGVSWPETSVRSQLAHWRRDPSTWPADRLGPPPGMPGCKLPTHILEEAA